MVAIDIKKQNKEAIDWILNFKERRDSYISDSANFSMLGSTNYSGMPKGSDTGNPTLNKAVTLTELERQKLWIITIESMESTLSEKRRIFLEFRRRAEALQKEHDSPGRPGWVEYVQIRYGEWHEYRYGKGFVPSRHALHKWLNELIEITVRIAIRQGIL